jgi:uncharacterized protein
MDFDSFTDEQRGVWNKLRPRVLKALGFAGIDKAQQEPLADSYTYARMQVLMARADEVSEKSWGDISESDYSGEQLSLAVPKAVLAWAKAEAKKDDREITKSDLKLRYKNPDGTVNINGIRAALSRLPQTDLPSDVLSKAKGELQDALAKAKKGLGIEDRKDGSSLRQSCAEVRIVRYDEDSGVLVADVPIAKMDVLPYLQEDGSVIYELKHPRDFTTPSFLASIPGKPVINGHAPSGVPFHLLDEAERNKWTCGIFHTGQDYVWVEDGKIYAREVVYDEELINQLRSGELVQVSTGIMQWTVDEDGSYNGKAYQKRQTKPLLDHLAHVRQGRCGPECAVALDGAIEILGGNMTTEEKEKDKVIIDASPTDEQEATTTAEKDKQVAAPKTDDKKEDTSKDDLQAQLDSLEKEKTDAQTKIDELKAKLDKAEGERDGKNTQVDELQKRIDTLEASLSARLDAEMDERLDMVGFMQRLIADYDYHGKATRDMVIDALAHFNPDFEAKDRSDDYLSARFDTLREMYERQQKDPTGQFTLKNEPKADEKEIAKAKQRAEARTTGLYRDPHKKQEA